MYHEVCIFLRHSQGSYIVPPLLSLEAATPENRLAHRRCRSCASPPHLVVLSRMQLTAHPSCDLLLRARCKQCLPGR